MAGKMEGFGRRLDEMSAQVADKAAELKTAVGVKGIDTHDSVKEKLADAQGDLTAATEQVRVNAEETQSHVSAKLLGAQMGLRAKKDEIAAEMGVRKAINDQQRAAKQVQAADDYAEYAVQYALMAVDEAKWAILDAQDKRMDYQETYGQDAEDEA